MSRINMQLTIFSLENLHHDTVASVVAHGLGDTREDAALGHLLEESEGKTLIRWDSSRKVEWVSVKDVEKTCLRDEGEDELRPKN